MLLKYSLTVFKVLLNSLAVGEAVEMPKKDNNTTIDCIKHFPVIVLPVPISIYTKPIFVDGFYELGVIKPNSRLSRADIFVFELPNFYGKSLSYFVSLNAIAFAQE